MPCMRPRGGRRQYRWPRPRTLFRPLPRRCGGRPNGQPIKDCYPATSSLRRVPRYYAAGCARVSNCTATMGCPCHWRSSTTSSPSTSRENRILRTACERMLAVPLVDAESQRMLRRLLRDFSDVTPLHRGEQIPGWQATRLNARYHSALRLAELVLRATSVEHESGTVTVNGFLLDMPGLFEDFVTVALREALVPAYGGRVDDQDQ